MHTHVPLQAAHDTKAKSMHQPLNGRKEKLKNSREQKEDHELNAGQPGRS